MKQYQIQDIAMWYDQVSAGEQILLSGTIYTARDAAHKKIMAALENGESLPFPLANTAIYYAGPTPAKNGFVIGACGPTTSTRMDPYIPSLAKLGLRCTIGKGDRDATVYEALKTYGGIYLSAIGGAGALYAKCITECQVIAYEELGCESVKRLVVQDLPLFVAIDSKGNSIYQR